MAFVKEMRMTALMDHEQAGEAPNWLDEILGCLSPAFNSRHGGSPISDGIAARPSPAVSKPARSRQRGR